MRGKIKVWLQILKVDMHHETDPNCGFRGKNFHENILLFVLVVYVLCYMFGLQWQHNGTDTFWSFLLVSMPSILPSFLYFWTFIASHSCSHPLFLLPLDRCSFLSFFTIYLSATSVSSPLLSSLFIALVACILSLSPHQHLSIQSSLLFILIRFYIFHSN